MREAMQSATLSTASSARRSDRRKKQARREKARKSVLVDRSETSNEIRLESLEALDGQTAQDDEEEYLEEEERETGSKRKRGGKRGASKKNAGGAIPKRLRPRSLASALIEDSGREDGVAKKYLEAEARPDPDVKSYPPRKFCPVTGLFGIYTDPKSGIPYANLRALEQIRERAPPWMTMGGSSTYYETLRSLRNEE